MTRQEQEAARAAKVAAIERCRKEIERSIFVSDLSPALREMVEHFERERLRAFAPIPFSLVKHFEREQLGAFAPLTTVEHAEAFRLIAAGEAMQRDPDYIDVMAMLFDVDPCTRENAAQRLVGRMRNPVHRTRWNRVAPALREMAKGRHQSPQKVLATLTLQALWGGITDVLSPFTPGELRTKGMPALKARINAEVTADVLGPGWRRPDVSLDTEKVGRRVRRRTAAEDPGADARLVLDQLVKKAGLTPRERELIAALRAGKDLTQAATRLRIKPSTARVLWGRARKKLLATT